MNKGRPQTYVITKDELEQLYVDKMWSMADIAKHYGCSVQTILNNIRKNNIQPRSCAAHTERTRTKQALAKKGSNNPHYGKKRPEHAIRMRKVMLGRTFSEESKRKMSLAKHGKFGGKYIGETHPRWVPPEYRKTTLYKQIRDSVKMWEWRCAIFKRDAFTCQLCGQRGGILNADHIKQFAVIIMENGVRTNDEAMQCAELWSLENGRTLCKACHRQTSTYARKVNHG